MKKTKPTFKNGKTLKVLITCGGGIFGVVTAYMLASLDEKYKHHFNSFIDVYGGTSIGGINALFLALHENADELVEAYNDGSKDIFAKSMWNLLRTIKGATYPNSNIDPFLKKFLGGLSENPVKVFDLHEKVVIPTVDFKEEEPFIITNLFPEKFDRNLPVWLAGASTAAAPTYFQARDWMNGKYILVDGGVIENMPIVSTLTAIKSAYDIEYDQIDMFVVGTGCKNPPPGRTIKDVQSFSIIDWLTEFLIPFVTTSNECCSTFWGGQFGLHYYDVFNPVPIEGAMDDIDLLYPTKKYPKGFLKTISEPYFEDFRNRWIKFMEA